MNTKQNDIVTEYLHEVDLRLSGLPVLQRRELLADLAAHVVSQSICGSGGPSTSSASTIV